MTLPLEHIRTHWGWTGLDPAEIKAMNAFGNLIVADTDGVLWRITPEDLSCAPFGLPTIPWDAPGFQADWDMAPLVAKARAALGPAPAGTVYQIVIPPPLGGTYEAENMAICTLGSLLEITGALARQIEGLPDGTDVQIAVVPS